MFPFPTDLAQFVSWLGGSAVVGVIVSLLLEKLPFWREAPSWVPVIFAGNWSRLKRVFVFLLSTSLPSVSAWILAVVPPESFTAAQVYVNYALAGLVTWFAAEVFHAVNPVRSYNYKG